MPRSTTPHARSTTAPGWRSLSISTAPLRASLVGELSTVLWRRVQEDRDRARGQNDDNDVTHEGARG